MNNTLKVTGSIEEQVLDIERKLKYARYAFRVLKTCNLHKEFLEYTKTDNYKHFRRNYISKHPRCVFPVWYDYETCAEILGSCNFTHFLDINQIEEKYDTYELLLCYLAIFDEDEYIRYAELHKDRKYEQNPQFQIDKFLNESSTIIPTYTIHNENSRRNKEIVENWLKIRDSLNLNFA